MDTCKKGECRLIFYDLDMCFFHDEVNKMKDTEKRGASVLFRVSGRNADRVFSDSFTGPRNKIITEALQ